MRKTLLLISLILLAGLALRLFRLGEIPPGLTHDEANHGREAIEILDGVLRYYFPLNYGSEPLYSYTVAGAMALLGENIFALRLVNVIFGLAAIVATAVWARRAFDRATALVAAGLLAVSFWPIASSREALRAGMLPFFMVLAVWFFWQ
ncbi:MAG: ArnT family glycosyltransferase, partial [Candidatus Promineifilaceae bacterium]